MRAGSLSLVAILASALSLSACGAIDHRQGAGAAEAGAATLDQAERAAIETPGLTEATPQARPAEARRELAANARLDLERAAASPGASDLDRVSHLYRASINAWHAGNAWTNAPTADPQTRDRIFVEGRTLCERLAAAGQDPERDCTVIRAAPDLTAMEIAASEIVDAHADRLAGEPGDEARLATLFAAVRDISETLEESTSLPPPQVNAGDDLARFVNAQRLAYLCHATAGLQELIEVGVLGDPLADRGFEAVQWLAGTGTADAMPAELSGALERRGVRRVPAARGAFDRAVHMHAPLLGAELTAAQRELIAMRCQDLLGSS